MSRISKHNDSYERDVILKSKTAPFIKLIDKIKSIKGSDESTAKYIGFSRKVLYKLRKDGYLQVKNARLILKRYNELK